MQILNTLLIGITAGSIYALMAISFVLVWRSTRGINFAQAGMALLSTYFGYEAVTRIGSFWIALPIAMIGGAIFAALVEVILMRLLVKMHLNRPRSSIRPFNSLELYSLNVMDRPKRGVLSVLLINFAFLLPTSESVKRWMISICLISIFTSRH